MTGPLAWVVGIFLLKQIKTKNTNGIRKLPFTMIIAPPIAFYLGGVHLWAVGTQVVTALRFRAIDPGIVAAIEIHPSARSDQATIEGIEASAATARSLLAKEQVVDFLQTLTQAGSEATAVNRSTDPLMNGFVVKLIPAAHVANWPAQGWYISVYDQRSTEVNLPNAPRAIVVPHLGPAITPTTHAGYYSAPVLLHWLQQVMEAGSASKPQSN